MTTDILIKNAKTRFAKDKLVSIAIKEGLIQSIGEDHLVEADHTIDAKGKLVTESYVNGHLHLCKVYTLEKVGEEALVAYQGDGMGKAMSAIDLASRVKEEYDEKWIIENVRKALKLAVKYGNTHIRALADVDTKAKLEGIKALLKAKEEFKDSVELQIVAFPQDGVVKDPGADVFVRQAMELGADVVGGIPWIEYTNEDSQKHIDDMFALAVEFDKDVSMLIDDAGDAGLRTLEMLAVKAIKEGWEGRVMVHHARAMALYPEPYFEKVLALLKRARIGVVSDPQTGPLHARVRDLYDYGVDISLGQDDISDAYYPYGRNNMPEVAFLASHLLWMTTYGEMEILYDLITTNAARAMGIRNFELKEGNPANLVVTDADSICNLLREHAAPLHVIKDGKDVTLSS